MRIIQANLEFGAQSIYQTHKTKCSKQGRLNGNHHDIRELLANLYDMSKKLTENIKKECC